MVKRLLIATLLATALLGCGGSGGTDNPADFLNHQFNGSWEVPDTGDWGAIQCFIDANGTLVGDAYSEQLGRWGHATGTCSGSGQVSATIRFTGLPDRLVTGDLDARNGGIEGWLTLRVGAESWGMWVSMLRQGP